MLKNGKERGLWKFGHDCVHKVVDWEGGGGEEARRVGNEDTYVHMLRTHIYIKHTQRTRIRTKESRRNVNFLVVKNGLEREKRLTLTSSFGIYAWILRMYIAYT